MKYYFFIILFAIFGANLYSQEEELYEENDLTENVEEEEEHAHSESYNDIGLFIGATSFTGAGSWTKPTIGVEYERVISTEPHVFMGLYGEYIIGEHPEFLTGLPVGIEFFGVKTYLAPSVLFSSGHEEAHLDSTSHDEEENFKDSKIKFFLRFGAGYKLHFDHFSIVPNIAVDIISGKTYLVYGVTFGYGF